MSHMLQDRIAQVKHRGDLTQVGDYMYRFGYVWDRFGWEAITIITLEMLVIIYLVIDKYLS